MNIGEILAPIESFAPPELQEGYDNSGLITGDRDWICRGVMCCVDVTLEVVKEAIEKDCNLIVSHHPIVFHGIKSITGSTYVERVLIAAIKKDIALYAAHTNLDNVLLGVSGAMAGRLGLVNQEVLEPKHGVLRRLITFAPIDSAASVRKAVFDAGAGHIGNYTEVSFNTEGTGSFKAGEGANPFVGEIGKLHYERETKIEIVYPFYLEKKVVKALVSNHPYEEVAYDIFTMNNVHLGIGAGIVGELEHPLDEITFLNQLRDVFGAGALKFTELLGKPIKKVAVCGGAGSFLVKAAIKAGADIFISSDFKYHEFFDAEGKIVLADIGHYESEQFTVDLISGLLAKKFPTFAVLKTGTNTNPVRYLS